MTKDTSVLDGVVEGENLLNDDYPVYAGYLYVADGRVVMSDLTGTVRHLKADKKAKEIRRCNIVARNLCS